MVGGESSTRTRITIPFRVIEGDAYGVGAKPKISAVIPSH